MNSFDTFAITKLQSYSSLEDMEIDWLARKRFKPKFECRPFLIVCSTSKTIYTILVCTIGMFSSVWTSSPYILSLVQQWYSVSYGFVCRNAKVLHKWSVLMPFVLMGRSNIGFCDDVLSSPSQMMTHEALCILCLFHRRNSDSADHSIQDWCAPVAC